MNELKKIKIIDLKNYRCVVKSSATESKNNIKLKFF